MGEPYSPPSSIPFRWVQSPPSKAHGDPAFSEVPDPGLQGLALGWPWVDGTGVGTSREERGLPVRLVCHPVSLYAATSRTSNEFSHFLCPLSPEALPAHPATPPAGCPPHGCLWLLPCPHFVSML